MKFELRTIGYWSLIKISFVVNLIAGFIVGIGIALFMGLMISFAERMAGLAGMPPLPEDMPPIGFLMILYPFMISFGAAIFNTILYVIIAFIYNITAKVLGGIEVELNEVKLQPVSYAAPQPVQPQAPRPQPPPPPPAVEPMPPEITQPPQDENQDKEEL
ncbi:MAG: DUF3566 domain-containing protein [Candidatus Zixiibacteriota bacterium]|nr:MAG: DUF3566 domain-containing protein [candidate division Zixibacteria bacterium]